MAENRKRENSVGRILVILIVLILIAFVVHALFFRIRTEIMNKVSLEDKIQTQGLVIRSEKSTAIPKGANVKYYTQDGQRVAKKARLLEVLDMNRKDVDLSVQIAELDEQIQQIKTEGGNTELFQSDKDKLNANILNKTLEIKAYIQSENLDMVSAAKDDLSRYLYKKSLIGSGSVFVGSNLEALEKKKAELEQIYKKNYKVIYAEEPGIVCYEPDGLESILTPDKIEKMTVSDVSKMLENPNGQKANSEGGVKIVDDYIWYISSIVEDHFAKDLKEGTEMSVRFTGLSGEPVPCTVYKISKSENGQCVLTLKFTQQVDDFYKMRIESIDIIKGVYSGYKVSKDAVIEKDGQKGIYLCRDQIVKFVPIVVVKEIDSNHVLIEDLVDRPNKFKDYAYLERYDEVITNPSMARENKPIN